MEKVKKFVSGLRAELKKIVWPTAGKTAAGLGASLTVIVASAAVIFGFDKLSETIITFVIGLF